MRGLLGAVAALFLLAGCKVETTVGIHADADGTGRVRVEVALDGDAVQRVPDLAKQLRVDDLRAAGWQVDEPQKTDDDGLTVEAEKRFRTTAEASQVVEEVSGPAGPFRHFELQRDRSFFKTKTAFAGTVDLSGGVEAFGDDALRERLGGSPLGFDPAGLEQQLGTALSRIFEFRVVARLPGDVESNAPTSSDNGAVWRPVLGERVLLEATAERWNVRNIGAAAVSLAAAVALVVVLARRRAARSA